METNRIRLGWALPNGLILASISIAILGSAEFLRAAPPVIVDVSPDYSRPESPLITEVAHVVSGPTAKRIDAEIIPLVWRAKIGKAVTSVLLSSIENYGIQDYEIDRNLLVRELTITTHSLSMIRIYHAMQFGAIDVDAAKQLDAQLERIKRLRAGQDKDLPIKNYPTTTHEKMVEYRVSEACDIDVLYESLDQAMITYLGRDLVPVQRGSVVQAVAVEKGE